MNKTYHLGLRKGYTSRTRNTVYLEARRNVDFLSCELWLYIGERIVTKSHLQTHKNDFLQWINQKYATNFKHIVLD